MRNLTEFYTLFYNVLYLLHFLLHFYVETTGFRNLCIVSVVVFSFTSIVYVS